MKNARQCGYLPRIMATRFLTLLGLGLFLSLTLLSSGAHAQEREVPYWATMRFDEVNMRVGPSQEYKIDWVYKRKGMPVRVIRLREGWRLVQDHEGTQGWIAASQLSPKLGAMVIGDSPVELRQSPSDDSPVRWRAEPGVVGELVRCRDAYCEVDIAGRSGWALMERLWGAGEIEAE